jgi:hypothetical protein
MNVLVAAVVPLSIFISLCGDPPMLCFSHDLYGLLKTQWWWITEGYGHRVWHFLKAEKAGNHTNIWFNQQLCVR